MFCRAILNETNHNSPFLFAPFLFTQTNAYRKGLRIKQKKNAVGRVVCCFASR